MANVLRAYQGDNQAGAGHAAQHSGSVLDLSATHNGPLP